MKVSALLFTSAFLLGACGQEKKEETTIATTQAITTTATPTTATPTTVYSLEDAQKAVFEAASNSGTDTMTLYYKDDVLLKEEKVSTFIIGVEYNTDYKDDVFTITNSYDYTKLDMQKLKEVYPNLNLRDDKTLSYSEFKEGLLNSGYKEKQ